MRYLILIMALFSFPAQAGNWYIGAGGGPSYHDELEQEVNNWRNDLAANGINATVTSEDTDLTLRLFGGYNFNRRLAVEAGYVDLGTFSANTTVIGTTSKLRDEFSADGLTVAAVGFIPLGRVTLLGKFGLFRWTTTVEFKETDAGTTIDYEKARSSGIDPFVGVGAQFSFTKKFGLRVQYEHYIDVGNKNTPGPFLSKQSDIGALTINALLALP